MTSEQVDRIIEAIDTMDREIEEVIDARPEKRVIRNKAQRCPFPNAIAEIIDNCLDYWNETGYDKPLKIHVDIENPEEDDQIVSIGWNMGVPKDRWRPLLTPGSTMHSGTEAIGVWGEGFKIAIFAIGKKIDIFTDNDNIRNWIDISDNFLAVKDWTIPVYKGIDPSIRLEKDHTVVRVMKKGFYLAPRDTHDLEVGLGETFGTRMAEERANGHEVEIKINGKPIVPITFCSEEDIRNKYAFPPGYEPTRHIFHEPGVEITMIVGILNTMDAYNYGVFMYGNGRLFAKRIRDAKVGFGTRANSTIPADHPTAKRLQVHVFFKGSSDKIPWQAPLKDQVIENHEMISKVADLIKEYAAPYARFMVKCQVPELLMFSVKRNVPEEQRKTLLLTTVDRNLLRTGKILQSEIDERWKALPVSLRGDFISPELQTWDHRDTNKGRKPVEAPKFETRSDRKHGNRVMNLLEERDKTPKLGSFDLLPKLMNEAAGGYIPAPPKPDTGKENKPNLGGSLDPPMDEGSITLSFRLEGAKIDEMMQQTGAASRTEMMRAVVDGYGSLVGLKKHPYFKKGTSMSDGEFLEEVRRILDEKSAQSK